MFEKRRAAWTEIRSPQIARTDLRHDEMTKTGTICLVQEMVRGVTSTRHASTAPEAFSSSCHTSGPLAIENDVSAATLKSLKRCRNLPARQTANEARCFAQKGRINRQQSRGTGTAHLGHTSKRPSLRSIAVGSIEQALIEAQKRPCVA